MTTTVRTRPSKRPLVAGERVKLRGTSTRTGTVVDVARTPSCVIVQWDGLAPGAIVPRSTLVRVS